MDRVANTDFHSAPEFSLSRARFAKLPARTLLAPHHIGDYGELHERFGTREDPWDELLAWAREHGVAASGERIGVYYDDPTVTPKSLHRAEICVPVEGAVAGTERIRSIPFDGGLYAVVEYQGPTSSVLSKPLRFESQQRSVRILGACSVLEFLEGVRIGGTRDF